MTAQTMSKEAERKILKALEQAGPMILAGETPNLALAKAAVAEQIPSGHLHLMASAYNTARTETQRKQAEHTLDRAESFLLADPETIAASMFPAATKTAGALRDEYVVDPSYRRPPDFLRDREEWERKAELKPELLKVAAPQRVEKTASVIEKLAQDRHLVSEARIQSCATLEKLGADIEALHDHLARHNDYHVVRANSVTFFGKKAEQLFDMLAERNRTFRKQARSQEKAIDPDKAPYSLVEAAIKSAESFLLAEENRNQLTAEAARREVELKSPFFQGPTDVLGPSSTKQAFLGGFLGTAIGTTAGRELANQFAPGQASLKQKTFDKMTDPQHEISMRNLQTESMLNDLMANDEVISTHDPNEVLTHFNEVAQLAPRTSNQSGLMRTVLRKRLQQGALDPYEIEMLLKIENGLRMRDGVSQGVPDNATGSGVLG